MGDLHEEMYSVWSNTFAAPQDDRERATLESSHERNVHIYLGPSDEDVAGYPSEQQHDSQSESENIDISSLNIDSDDDESEEVQDDEESNKVLFDFFKLSRHSNNCVHGKGI